MNFIEHTMSLKLISAEWSDYEIRKSREQKDVKVFNCFEMWEWNFLQNKIKDSYPLLRDAEILTAIRSCN